MYVGYAVLCLLMFGVTAAVACIAPLQRGVEALAAYFFPDAGVVVVLAFLGAIALIYVLSQLTIISNRLVRTVQRAAVRDALPDRVDKQSAENDVPRTDDGSQSSSHSA
jgi:hypothetical protein